MLEPPSPLYTLAVPPRPVHFVNQLCKFIYQFIYREKRRSKTVEIIQTVGPSHSSSAHQWKRVRVPPPGRPRPAPAPADDDRAVYCSFLGTNLVYLWGGYVLQNFPRSSPRGAGGVKTWLPMVKTWLPMVPVDAAACRAYRDPGGSKPLFSPKPAGTGGVAEAAGGAVRHGSSVASAASVARGGSTAARRSRGRINAVQVGAAAGGIGRGTGRGSGYTPQTGRKEQVQGLWGREHLPA